MDLLTIMWINVSTYLNTIQLDYNKKANMTEDKKFHCPRCGVSMSLKANMTSHLKNRTLCEAKVADITREDALKMFEVTRKLPCIECQYCKKTVTKKSYTRHLLTCRNKPSSSTTTASSSSSSTVTNDVLLERLDRIEAMFNGLQQHGSTYNTFNNVVNNTLNITIKPYGSETMTHLTSEFLSHCLHNPTKGITKLIENIHYNADVPENYNLKFKSNKNGTFEKYMDEQWIECDASNTLDELIRKGYRVLSKHYDDNYRDKPEYDEDDLKREAIEMFRFLADTTSVKYCSVKRDMRLLVKNKTVYVIAPPNNGVEPMEGDGHEDVGEGDVDQDGDVETESLVEDTTSTE